MQCPVEDVFFGGARGGGKSDGLVGDCLYHCALYRKRANCYLFRRSYPDLEELLDRAVEIMEAAGGKYRLKDKRFVFPAFDGASVRMRFLDKDEDAKHYQGRNINYIGIDEIGQFATPTAPDLLWGALRSAHGVPAMFRATGNPGGPGHTWIAERYINPVPPMTVQEVTLGEGKHTHIHRRVFIPSYLTDNRILMEEDPGYVGRLHLVGPNWLVQAWLKGDWSARPIGGFFDTTKIRYGIPPRMSHIYAGVDPATRDADAKDREWKDRDHSAIVIWGVDQYRRHWILDVFRKQVDTAKLLNHMFKFQKKYNVKRWYMEGGQIHRSVEPFWRERMDAAGKHLDIVPVQASAVGDKAVRATPLQALVNHGALWLPQDQTPWLREFLEELQVFDPVKAKADEIHDDQVDAAAWVALKVLSLAKSKDPSRAKKPLNPAGKPMDMLEDGRLDGRIAEEILAQTEKMRRAGDLNPHNF